MIQEYRISKRHRFLYYAFALFLIASFGLAAIDSYVNDDLFVSGLCVAIALWALSVIWWIRTTKIIIADDYIERQSYWTTRIYLDDVTQFASNSLVARVSANDRKILIAKEIENQQEIVSFLRKNLKSNS